MVVSYQKVAQLVHHLLELHHWWSWLQRSSHVVDHPSRLLQLSRNLSLTHIRSHLHQRLFLGFILSVINQGFDTSTHLFKRFLGAVLCWPVDFVSGPFDQIRPKLNVVK